MLFSCTCAILLPAARLLFAVAPRYSCLTAGPDSLSATGPSLACGPFKALPRWGDPCSSDFSRLLTANVGPSPPRTLAWTSLMARALNLASIQDTQHDHDTRIDSHLSSP